MNRLEFIKYGCAMGFALGVGAFAYSWMRMGDEAALRQGYTPEKIQALTEDEAAMLYLASLAPSGHNAQPWTITLKEPKQWIVGSAQERWLPAVDPDNREMMLSIGAFLENLSVAAGIKGYAAEIDVIGKDNFSSEIAKVKFINSKETGASEEAITERRTVRKNLLKKAISADDIDYLIAENNKAIFYYPLDSKEGLYLSQATLLANKAQVYREDAQKELAEWIRWTERDAKEYGNGLTPESMGMKGIARWYAKHFLGKDDVLGKTFKTETLKMVEEQVQSCAGWLVVTSDSSQVADLISTGRMFQSVWLRAREKSIAFHPMTQILEEEPWRTEAAKELGHSGSIQFVVRVGYINDYPKPVSLRMPISKIIIT